MRYYQQVQALDVEGAWERVAVPTLIVWGEYDWIMGRDESDRVRSAAEEARLGARHLRRAPGAWTTISTFTRCAPGVRGRGRYLRRGRRERDRRLASKEVAARLIAAGG
jgi:hypothetical protein